MGKNHASQYANFGSLQYYESRFKVLQALYDYITILFNYINYKY